MSNLKLNLEKRERGIKNPFTKSIHENYIPCIVYNNKENFLGKLQRNEFITLYQNALSNTIFDFELDGKKRSVFIKDLDYSLTKSRDIMHIDFYLLEPKGKVKLQIPFNVTGVPMGVQRGGYMEIYKKSLLVQCSLEDIPKEILHDITSFDLGQKLYLEDIQKSNSKIRFIGASDLCLLSVNVSRKSLSQNDQTSEDGKTEEEKV